ncbi:MAG: hypothetical protein LBV17_03600 [Treponema sp.]|jgi:hypothetical protein|nr:hypothetical protein [Treponema sp.]
MIFDNLFSKDTKLKYKTVKEYANTAKENPQKIYPEIEKFIGLMDNKNNILKWTAIDIIGYCAKMDIDKKIDPIMNKIIKRLNCGKMVTAAHAISSLTDIALGKPEYRNKIINGILKTEEYKYDTEKCHYILMGKVIMAFDKLLNIIGKNKNVIMFLERQTESINKLNKTKAEKLIKKMNKSCGFSG